MSIASQYKRHSTQRERRNNNVSSNEGQTKFECKESESCYLGPVSLDDNFHPKWKISTTKWFAMKMFQLLKPKLI